MSNPVSWRETLASAKEKHSLVGVYTGIVYADDFDVGYVLGVTDDLLSLCRISPLGLDDGVLVCRTSCVVKVDVEGKYLQRVVVLRQQIDEVLGGEFRPQFVKHYADYESDDFLRRELNEACDHRDVVHVFAGDLDQGIEGLILRVDEKMVRMREIDEYGAEIRTSVIATEDISRIQKGGVQQRKLRVLYESEQRRIG